MLPKVPLAFGSAASRAVNSARKTVNRIEYPNFCLRVIAQVPSGSKKLTSCVLEKIRNQIIWTQYNRDIARGLAHSLYGIDYWADQAPYQIKPKSLGSKSMLPILHGV